MWLDSIGTCIGGCLGGPIIGAICGAANNLIYGFSAGDNITLIYALTSLGIGAAAGIMARLAGSKADEWWLRQCPKVMNLPFKEKIRRADRDNTINVYISDEWEDVLQDGVWEQFFTEKPEPLTREEKKAWIAQNKGVSLGSDAFFPFGDNIERAHKSGVEYIAEAGGSIRDDHVIDTCDKYGIAMAFTHVSLVNRLAVAAFTTPR